MTVLTTDPLVADLSAIREVVNDIDVIAAMERAFIQLSHGDAVLGPVGELLLPERRGEVHLKYGWIRDTPSYVVKIASGFYGNARRGLSSSNGLMLVFDAETGAVRGVLLDEGWLTDLRTAAAGALAARTLARTDAQVVGLLGTGTQARLQMEWLREVVSTRDAVLWGRSSEAAEKCAADLEVLGWRVRLAGSADDVAAASDLLVTTTAAEMPLISAGVVRAGTHVTAVGSDTESKQELPPTLLSRAGCVVTDSRAQCVARGEIAQALESGDLELDEVVELGEILSGERPGRSSDEEITVADLTGVAVQDIEIAVAVLDGLNRRSNAPGEAK